MWKYAPNVMSTSEYLLHTSILSMLELNEDIFAAGNCYDTRQYNDYFLFCPYAYRLPEGNFLAKDLALEYNYLSNTSEWFFIARRSAEKVIMAGKSLKTSKSFPNALSMFEDENYVYLLSQTHTNALNEY
jgi:G protein-coupled receptor 158